MPGPGRDRAFLWSGPPDDRCRCPPRPAGPGDRLRGPRHPPAAAPGSRPRRAEVVRRRDPGRARPAGSPARRRAARDARVLFPGEQQPAADGTEPARAPQHRGLPDPQGAGDHRAEARHLPRPADGAGGDRDRGRDRGRHGRPARSGKGGQVTAGDMDLGTALRKRVLICDGAMGTMLHAAGNSLDRALTELNLSNPGLVSTIHESYLSAGADVILTNTFGASRQRLAEQGYGDLVTEINEAGARLAIAAREGIGRPAFVAGSVAPAVTPSLRRRVEPAERAE